MTKKIDPDQKVKKEGWVRSSMMIEVLAVSKDVAKSSLEKHIKAMEMVKNSYIYKKEFKDIVEVKNPFPKIETAYSYVVDLELVSKDFETLLFLVMNFAPSNVEILEPKELKMDIGEAQGVLLAVVELLHRFAQLSIGGVHISA